ncbi:MAG: hypothetical protein ACXVZR_05050 [Terriglobales bacterium]
MKVKVFGSFDGFGSFTPLVRDPGSVAGEQAIDDSDLVSDEEAEGVGWSVVGKR